MEFGILGTVVISTLSALGTGFASYFFTRAKYKAEVKGNDIQNMNDSLKFYQNLADDTNKRLEQMIQQNNALEKQIDTLREDNRVLKKEIAELTEQMEALKNLIAKRRGRKPKNEKE